MSHEVKLVISLSAYNFFEHPKEKGLRIGGFSVPRTRLLSLVDARSQTAYKFLLSIFAFRKCDTAHLKGALGLPASFFILPQFL